jgi:hypothetical protein
MLIFNLTIHHLWDKVLVKFPEARAIVYVDDGYVKAKLSIALQVLAELKVVFKTDAGLELNVNKTSILLQYSEVIVSGLDVDIVCLRRSLGLGMR